MKISPSFLLLALCALPGHGTGGEVEFRRDILPILSENCFHCHGPDSATRKSGLRLDRRDGAVSPAESGSPAIVPGKPDDSALIQRILSHDPDLVMPPPSSKKSVPAADVDKLRRWIADGAVYQNHWAFDPIRRPEPPDAGGSNWPRNPIDHFILRRLADSGLKPSPEADRAALLRRVTLDLTGMPPGPEEIRDFLSDREPGAYERVVDRLLASPRYGERMALPWLDAARYADSNGFQQDGDTHQHVWRDWVVKALNENMPFDRFAIEQLAGDLLPSATIDQKIATAFNRNHLLNGEGGAIAEEQRNVILFDRVDVTATTFLGLTMACAQCHDHKYDPLPQRDYYRMMAFFNQVPETGMPPGGGQYRIAEPWIHAGAPAEMERLAALEEAARAASVETPELARARDEWEKSIRGLAPVSWVPVRPVSAESDQGVTLTVEEDHSLMASGPRPERAIYQIQLPKSADPVTGIRIETIPDARLPSKGAGRSDSGNAVITRIRLLAGGAPVPLVHASADYSQGGFSAAGAIDEDPATAWAFYPDVTTPHHLVVQASSPVPAGVDMVFIIEFQSVHTQHQLGRFRVLASSSPEPSRRAALPQKVVAALAKAADSRSAGERALILDQFIDTSSLPAAVAFREARKAAESALGSFRESLPKVMVMSDDRPRKTHVFDRGNYLTPAAEVSPGTPECLPPMDPSLPANRLGFARWLVSGDHPLTPRVQVNRYWQLFFGTGIVKSSENLGVQADAPTHPELLDWLAAEFRGSAWNVKHIHRLIVTSATYRQSAVVTPSLLEVDPENKLLARAPRLRLSSPILRDLALSASGLLDTRMGGKPVYPYQPKGIWDGLSITKERDFTYPQSTGADLHRRSLYTFWRRTVAPGNMFDASTRNTCSVKPSVTNTPLHALTTLNDVTWVEAARALAARVAGEEPAGNVEAWISGAFLRVCSRSPSAAELAVLHRSHAKALARFQADAAAAEAFLSVGEAARRSPMSRPDFAALSAVCLTILNLDEALNRG